MYVPYIDTTSSIAPSPYSSTWIIKFVFHPWITNYCSFRVLQMKTGMSNCLMGQDGSYILLDQVILMAMHIISIQLKKKIPIFTSAGTPHAGVMAVLLLLALRLCNMFRPPGRDGYEAGEIESERTPLLSQKDDDSSSWGSSYDSNSHEEEDLEKWLAVNCIEGKSVAEGENLRRLCVICFDAPRDCFFLPCGHCAACFTCGTRYL